MPSLNPDILKQAREESGLSQKELAKNLDISQTQVSRYEKDPEAIPAGLFTKWIGMFGLDPADVLQEESGGELRADPGAPYSDFRTELDLIERYIDVQAPKSLDRLSEEAGRVTGKIPSTTDLKKELRRLRQKPNVMMAGGFDTGKSYLANTLMGKAVLPTSFQPATRIVTVVRHAEDRPNWQDEDVWLFDKGIWKTENADERIDVSRLDEKACKEHRILAGSQELLGKYGVHQREATQKVRERMEKAHSAVVYAEAPVLKGCNIIDLPGFGDRPSGKSDDQKKAESALPFADLVLYASRAKGNLSGKDLARISALLRQIPALESKSEDFPTLGSLFLVATHADRNISDGDLKEIKKGATERLHTYLESGVLARYEERSERKISVEDLRNQWFPFWAENTRRSRPLIDRLEEVLGKRLPEVRIQSAREELSGLRRELRKRCNQGASIYQEAAEESAKQRQRAQQLKEEADRRQVELHEKRDEVLSKIGELEEKGMEEVEACVEKFLDPEEIEDLIRDNFDDKSEAKDRAPALIVERIESKTEEILGDLNDELVEEIEDYLDLYEHFTVEVGDNSEEVKVPFDSRGAFAGGIAGVAAAGGLAAWAAALGPLGGYIIVAQGVGALSALGLSIGGGAAAVTAWVAALGGPITLGAAVAGVVGLAGWRLLSSDWQERLARKIKSHFEDEDVKGDFLEGVQKYWDDTKNAFEEGADAVEKEFKKHLNQLQELAADEERARELADKFEDASTFYSGIPLSEDGAR